MTDEAQLLRRLQQLMDGYLTTQVLYAASELGVLDALASRPQTAAELAEAVGVAAGPLRRILRGLVIEEVAVENDDGTFELTVLGCGSRPAVGAAPASAPASTTGRPPVSWMHSGPAEPRSRWSTANPSSPTSMRIRTLRPRSKPRWPGGRWRRPVTSSRRTTSVPTAPSSTSAAGAGILLAAILGAVPQATGILLDRPAPVEQARAHLAGAGLADRVRFVAGDFFDEVPAGGDAYLLARILHDWDDAAALKILNRCRAAMTPGSRLLVVDALLPERADRDAPGAIRMDLHMLVLFGSAERTGNDLSALIDQAGFRSSASSPRTRRTDSPSSRPPLARRRR